MSASVQAKEVVVNDIVDKMKKATGCVFINYIGLTVEEVTNLRSQFRAVGVEYHVLKNTLIKRAADIVGIEGLETYLNGPTAVAFTYDDPTAAARVLNDFMKKVKKTEYKCAVLDGKVLPAASAEALGSIPSKEILLAQLLSVMNAPVRGFAVALGAIRDQKAEAQG